MIYEQLMLLDVINISGCLLVINMVLYLHACIV